MQNNGSVNPLLEWEQLVSGYEFPPTTYGLSSTAILKYLKATGREEVWQASAVSEFVPPMAIAAHAMTAMTGLFKMPDGAIHIAEELEFHKTVLAGDTLTSHAKVGRKLSRGKFQMMVIEFSTTNENDEQVISGKTSIVLTG